MYAVIVENRHHVEVMVNLPQKCKLDNVTKYKYVNLKCKQL